MPTKKLDAALDQVAPALPSRFRFDLAGVAFFALVEADGENGCCVSLDIDLGRIPFSAEAPELRRHKLALLGLPDAHFEAKNGRLIVHEEYRLAHVPSKRGLVATALSLALKLRPEVVLGTSNPRPISRRPASQRQAWAA